MTDADIATFDADTGSDAGPPVAWRLSPDPTGRLT